MGGILSLLKSRKFWLSVAGILACVGVIPEEQAESLAGAIVLIVGVLVAAIAVEDHGKNSNGEKQ